MNLASPKFERTGAVLVLHSWWGLNSFFRRLCDRFAAQGFVALACHTYPGTGHWFFEDDRADAFEPKAAALAWKRTIDFLKRNMG